MSKSIDYTQWTVNSLSDISYIIVWVYLLQNSRQFQESFCYCMQQETIAQFKVKQTHSSYTVSLLSTQAWEQWVERGLPGSDTAPGVEAFTRLKSQYFNTRISGDDFI